MNGTALCVALAVGFCVASSAAVEPREQSAAEVTLREFSFDHVPLAVFVSEVSRALGSSEIRASHLDGTVTVHSRGPVTRGQATDLFRVILAAHDFSVEQRGGILELVPRPTATLSEQIYVLTLEAALDWLTALRPERKALGVVRDTVLVRGERGFVQLRSARAPSAGVVSELLDMLSAPAATGTAPFSISFESAPLDRGLLACASLLERRLVFDAAREVATTEVDAAVDLLERTWVEALLRALVQWGGFQLRENADGSLAVMPGDSASSVRPKLARPHPLLERWGVHPGDRIVAIDGIATPEVAKDAFSFARRLRPEQSLQLRLRDSAGAQQTIQMPAADLLKIFREYGFER